MIFFDGTNKLLSSTYITNLKKKQWSVTDVFCTRIEITGVVLKHYLLALLSQPVNKRMDDHRHMCVRGSAVWLLRHISGPCQAGGFKHVSWEAAHRSPGITLWKVYVMLLMLVRKGNSVKVSHVTVFSNGNFLTWRKSITRLNHTHTKHSYTSTVAHSSKHTHTLTTHLRNRPEYIHFCDIPSVCFEAPSLFG